MVPIFYSHSNVWIKVDKSCKVYMPKFSDSFINFSASQLISVFLPALWLIQKQLHFIHWAAN
jgi:hypothetical protein